MSDVKKAYEDATVVLHEAQKGYDRVVAEFRGAIKNDLSSISAATNKVQAETMKMNEAYHRTLATLTSDDMRQAIENAERLAAALTAISELKSHNITFAVLDKKPL